MAHIVRRDSGFGLRLKPLWCSLSKLENRSVLQSRGYLFNIL